jgi:cysteine-S-conjugate beta-lyase
VKIGAAIISNPTIKNAIESGLRASGAGSPNRFGMVATEAALRQGGVWLDALVPYLEANRDHFTQQIARVIPGARVMPMEATFLAWVDFSQTGLSHDEVLHRITKLARIAISPGPQFGPGGEDHIRFNIATHRARLDEALDRLYNAFSDLR